MLHFITLSVFPEIFESPLNFSIIKRAVESNLLKFTHYNIRDFSTNKHRNIDDHPYGGGAGLLLKPEPLFNAIEFIKSFHGEMKTIFFTPSGNKLSTDFAKSLINLKDDKYLLLCGRYEGIDQRVIDNFVDIKLSIGDYILTGGELAAIVFIDVMSCYIPGVLGNKESLTDESFNNNLLEYPQYTRPAEFRGLKVPEILLSGNHEKINQWRLKESQKITAEIRPDLRG